MRQLRCRTFGFVVGVAVTIGVCETSNPVWTSLVAQQVASKSSLVVSKSTVLQTPVSIDLDHVGVKSAVDALAANANVRIVYQEQLLDAVATMVSLHASKMPLGDALDSVLRGTGLGVSIAINDVIAIKAAPGASVASVRVEGIISGVVRDAKTKLPLRDVVILMDDAKKGVTTDGDGRFRIRGVASGTHVVHARKLTYAKRTQSVVVNDGGDTTIEVMLDASVNQLDQVVVTGTVVATELKAVPTAITIITGKELQERGVTRLYELFRGDVPGLFINRTGQQGAASPGEVSVVSRGSTNLSGGSLFGVPGNTEGIKTYVDGVELANRNFLGMIDPASIERIEILTGPQASTIYGSNAINGVMQIFTKRGHSARPQVEATLKSKWTQNSFGTGLAPNHLAETSASGVDGNLSYSVGGSWVYEGSWVPSVLGQTASGFGGARLNVGAFAVDANLRVLQNWNQSNGLDQWVIDVRNADGTGNYATTIPDHTRGANTDRQAGLSGTYTMTPWWSHTVTLGVDQLDAMSRKINQTYGSPGDTTYTLLRGTTNRMTAAYVTTVRIPLASLARAIVTVGIDESHSANQNMSSNYVPAPGTSGHYISVDYNGWGYFQTQVHEHGGFLQSEVGLWDALFLTYGVRAVYNPNIGKDQNPNLEPRYGIAYSQDVGGLTAKLRASYGTATRPPRVGAKDAGQYSLDQSQDEIIRRLWGTDVTRLANPDLVPESQQGWEGGADFYVGARGSLEVTRYNQTVDHLIVEPTVDSVDLLPIWRTAFGIAPWERPRFLTRNLNIGSVRNQGWGAKGTANLGAIAINGTYSWNKSRLIGITPRYRGQFPYYVVGSSFSGIPEHTYAVGLTYTSGNTRISYNIQGQGQVHANSDYTYLGRVGNVFRLSTNRMLRMQIPSTYAEVTPGYYLSDLNASRQVTTRVEALLEVHNLTNSYQSDISPTVAQPGRMTGIGVRVRF